MIDDHEGTATPLAGPKQQAGQIEDLRGLVEQVEPALIANMRKQKVFRRASELDKYAPTRSLHKILDLYALAEEGRLVPLISDCQKTTVKWDAFEVEYHRHLTSRSAARALASAGDASVAAIERALRETEKPRSWLIYSLACNSSMTAFSLLTDLTQLELSRDEASSVIWAIGMKGEAGVSMIQEIAEEPNQKMQRAAKD